MFKAIIGSSMVPDTEGLTENSMMEVIMKGTTNKHSAKFSDLFDVKQKTAVRQLGSDKMKHKEIRKGFYSWSTIKNRKGHT